MFKSSSEKTPRSLHDALHQYDLSNTVHDPEQARQIARAVAHAMSQLNDLPYPLRDLMRAVNAFDAVAHLPEHAARIRQAIFEAAPNPSTPIGKSHADVVQAFEDYEKQRDNRRPILPNTAFHMLCITTLSGDNPSFDPYD